MTSNKQIQQLIATIRGRKVLILATSNRWEGHDEDAKSTALAKSVADEVDAQFIDCSKLHIYVCEGNVSSAKGNTCGLKESVLKDPEKNPTGYHRCWASLNHKDDELWKISKAIFESDVVLFFASVRWGQTNSIHQKIMERLCWLENRHSTLKEDNILANKDAGIVILGHNWNGENTLHIQKDVLKFYGFRVPEVLSFNWQWTTDSSDESAEGYIEDRKDFQSIFGIGPKWLTESFKKWFERK
jgi:multimeric flavodoxin WrbA